MGSIQSGSTIRQQSSLVGFENVNRKQLQKTLTLCYANSVLQILFHHPIFVSLIEKSQGGSGDIIGELKEVLTLIKKKKNMQVVSTSKFMKFVEKQSGLFQRNRHQDCHQFYIWLMTSINEQLKKSMGIKNSIEQRQTKTRLEEQFFSLRTTRTQCQGCKNISQRTQQQVDLSLILPEPNVSLNYCITHYSKIQKLVGKQKFKCDSCNSLQDADKRTLIKSLPKFLTIHLRRFKYDEYKKSIVKLLWLVTLPTKLKLKSNYHLGLNEERKKNHTQQQGLYKLVGVVAHLGQGQNYGHYMSYLKIKDKWYLFNDDQINEIDQHLLEGLWGYKGVTKCAYMLFYSLI